MVAIESIKPISTESNVYVTVTDSEYGASEYLCYRVVQQREELGQDVPQTDFNKLCALAYDEVRDKGYEPDIPLYWYQYGYVLHDDGLNLDFLTTERATEWDRSGKRVTIDEETLDGFSDIPEWLRSAIDSAVEDLLEELGGRYGTRYAKKRSYREQAPNEFIQVMDEFRDELDKIDSVDPADRDEYVTNVETSFGEIISDDLQKDETEDDANIDTEELTSYLNRLTETYPDEYTHMRSEFLQWQSVCRQLISNRQLGELDTFQRVFWKYFSRGELRIQHNHNLPLRLIRKWKHSREENIEQCRDELDSYRSIAMKYKDETSKLQDVSEGYSQAVRSKYQELSEES